ncbi:MAG: hypothetical protein RIQ89_845 [Bacteroidota bacterium]|jgi:release factor glutamine methyltransferase
MNKVFKKILNNTYKPLLQQYLKKDRSYTWKNINLSIPAGIFHPKFFFSTQLLLRFLSAVDLNNKKIIEIGCGSGLISIYCAQQQGMVTSVDINTAAVKCTALNASINNVAINALESNLFANIPNQEFDILIINPPYYAGAIHQPADHAWYAGPNYEYFYQLFEQLPNYMNSSSRVFIILSEEGPTDLIKKLCLPHFTIYKIHTFNKWLEKNHIFEITLSL